MKRILLFVILFPSLSAHVVGQEKPISTDLFGIFIEDLNYTADGGLYAEMVQNRSFEYSPHDIDLHMYYKKGQWHPFTAWESLKDGNAISRISLETERPLNSNNRHYVTMTVFTAGSKGAGLGNTGYEGMVVRKGETYDFSVWLRCEDTNRMPVRVTLCRVNRKDYTRDSIFAEATLEANTRSWKKYEAKLTSNGDIDDAVLDIRFLQEGSISMDMVSLFPQNTFRGRKNGLRPDLAQALADLHPAFVRFPGGCLTHGDGLNNIYRWKHTVGPLEQRKEDYNIWNYHQSVGLGFYEYFQLCEDIGAKPLPVLAAGVSCQNSARSRGNGQQIIPIVAMTDLHVFGQRDGVRTTEWERDGKKYDWGNNRGLVLLRSFNLIHWTRTNLDLTALTCPTGEVDAEGNPLPWSEMGCAWAPEMITTEDGRIMMHFTTRFQRGRNHIRYVYMSDDFSRMTSEPHVLLKAPADDQGRITKNIIDSDITKTGDTYHLFCTEMGHPRHAVSKLLTGPYTFVPFNDGVPQVHEAPMLWKLIGEQKWILMQDRYSMNPHNFYFCETTDLEHFTPLGYFDDGQSPMHRTNFSEQKHGAVVQVTKKELNKLIKYWNK